MECKLMLDWKAFLALGIAASMLVVAFKVKKEESGSLLEHMFNKTGTQPLIQAK